MRWRDGDRAVELGALRLDAAEARATDRVSAARRAYVLTLERYSRDKGS